MSLKELPRLNIRISTNSWSGFKSHLFSFLSCFIWGHSLTVWPWLAWTLLYVDVLYKIRSVASASWLLWLKVYVPHPATPPSSSLFHSFFLVWFFQDKVSQVVLAVVEFTTKTRLVWNSYQTASASWIQGLRAWATLTSSFTLLQRPLSFLGENCPTV